MSYIAHLTWGPQGQQNKSTIWKHVTYTYLYSDILDTYE